MCKALFSHERFDLNRKKILSNTEQIQTNVFQLKNNDFKRKSRINWIFSTLMKYSYIFSADPQYPSSVINTNVIISHTGDVVWLSHGIFRSSCDINVEFFPFDIQMCTLKWASWTYDGYQVRKSSCINISFFSIAFQATWIKHGHYLFFFFELLSPIW